MITFSTLLRRCLLSQCPVCGKGRLFAAFRSIQKFRELLLPVQSCGACGFHFEREPGYYFGVITPILPILALFSGASFAGVAYFIFHAPLDTVFIVGGFGVATGFLGFFRTAIALYVALDHAISPHLEHYRDSSPRNPR